ncbi:hypothetical protein HpM116_06210 [Helicobacter pylori]
MLAPLAEIEITFFKIVAFFLAQNYLTLDLKSLRLGLVIRALEFFPLVIVQFDKVMAL